MDVDLGDRKASLDVRNLPVFDYFNVGNALADGNSIPATVSYKAKWKGLLARVRVDDAVEHFNGSFIENIATVEWSASEAGFSFVSDPASTSKNEFSEIGRETNGVFFEGV